MNDSYFLPYQKRWLDDDSKIKVWEKSRRIGATYVQSYEDVRDCIERTVPSVWFSSADESAAKEYIEYVEQWALLFDKAAKHLGQMVLDSEKDIKAFVVEFSNGTKIHALSSNPKKFRSKGGKVVLDEFAHHDDQKKMWSASKPATTWGYPLRILSTHLGKGLFYKFTEKIKNGKQKKAKWSLHTTSIYAAVKEGLARKILFQTLNREPTNKEITDWIAELREDCFDNDIWLQEYCCQPMDDATAFLTNDIIDSCEFDDCLKPLERIEGDLYGGMDIGRKKHLTVIWLLEKLGNVKYTRYVKVLDKAPFIHQCIYN